MTHNLAKFQAELVEDCLHVGRELVTGKFFIIETKISLSTPDDLKEHSLFYTQSTANAHA